MFTVCRSDSQLDTERSCSAQSAVDDAADAGIKFNLQILSVDDADFDNLLHDAVANGNWTMCGSCLLYTSPSPRDS